MNKCNDKFVFQVQPNFFSSSTKLFLAPLSATIDGKATLIGIGFVSFFTPDVQCDLTNTPPGNSFHS